MRKALVSLFKRYFRWLPVPHSFDRLFEKERLPVIVTQGHSILVEALLSAFASHHGCRLVPLRDQERDSKDDNILYWASLDDDQALARLLKLEAGSEFSSLNLFRGKGPLRSRVRYSIHLLDYIALLFGPPLRCRFLLIIFGAPHELPKFESPSVLRLRRKLRLDFYRNLRMVRGTPFQSFRTQARTVLSGPEFETALQKLERSTGKSFQKLRREAHRALRVIAARPKSWVFIPAAFIVRPILKRLFTDIQVHGLERFAQAQKSDTVILVPMHRSHLDYLLIGWVIYNANLNTPLIAAGINLSFWPFGSIIRSLGGYFVKRNARQDRLHAVMLKRYVSYLVKRGHLQKFFIEGGRSRSGRMRPPKFGLLKTMVSTYARGDRKDVLFVPVAITYEHVIEDTEYAKENVGLSKTKESLRSLFRARSIFRQRYKEVILRFGAPIRTSDFHGQENRSERSDVLVESVGLEIMHRLESLSGVGLRSLMCSALLGSLHYGLTREELSKRLRTSAALARIYAEWKGCEEYASFTPALELFLKEESDENRELYSAGVVSRQDFLGEEVFFIPGNIRFTADFYRNSILHFYIYPAALALSEVMHGHQDLEKLGSFHRLFATEFNLPPCDSLQNSLPELQEILRARGFVEKDNEGRFRFKDRSVTCALSGMMLTVIESHLWILSLLRHTSPLSNPDNRRDRWDYQFILRRAQNQFKVQKYFSPFTRSEVASLSGLTRTLESLSARGVISIQSRGGKPSLISLQQEIDSDLKLLRSLHQTAISTIREHEYGHFFQGNSPE